MTKKYIGNTIIDHYQVRIKNFSQYEEEKEMQNKYIGRECCLTAVTSNKEKIHPEDFKCAFTTAEGWGSFQQKIRDNKLTSELNLVYGNLSLETISLKISKKPKLVIVNLNGEKINNSYKNFDDKLSIHFNRILLKEGGELKIFVTC